LQLYHSPTYFAATYQMLILKRRFQVYTHKNLIFSVMKEYDTDILRHIAEEKTFSSNGCN
jgi:hypothetical protein